MKSGNTDSKERKYFILCDCINLEEIVNNFVELYEMMIQWIPSNDNGKKKGISVSTETKMNQRVTTELKAEMKKSVLHNKPSFVDSFYSIVTDLSFGALQRCLQMAVNYDIETDLEPLDKYEQNVLKSCCELVHLIDMCDIVRSPPSSVRANYKEKEIILVFELMLQALKTRFVNINVRRAMLEWCCVAPMSILTCEYSDVDEGHMVNKYHGYMKYMPVRMAVSGVTSLFSSGDILDIDTPCDFVCALIHNYNYCDHGLCLLDCRLVNRFENDEYAFELLIFGGTNSLSVFVHCITDKGSCYDIDIEKCYNVCKYILLFKT